MPEEMFKWSLVGAVVITALIVGVANVLAICGVVFSNNKLLKPLNRLVDAVFWIDERLAKLTFNRKHRDR